MPWTTVCLTPEDSSRFAQSGHRCLSYVQALREAQEQILESDPAAFLIGEGVDDAGGVFGSTKGLVERFGERVMDMPIAENGLTGVAIGAAAAGMRPIMVHMRTDFLPMCMDQLVNHAAKWLFMGGGEIPIPLTVRAIIGRGWGSAAQHSQGLHSLFLSVPGLRIAMPATPYDAKGLLLAAHRDPNPVLIFEHRWLYNSVGPVPEEQYALPLGRAVVRRPGRDATIVAVSHMLPLAVQAAAELAAEGIEAEVVDPRTIAPLDMETIHESVTRTRRLVICDVACRTAGYGAEIACRLAETDPGLLLAPLRRVSFPDLPTPASPPLEEAYYPGAKEIANAVREICRG
ncbi:MAG TPA: transketolase C-terminal domain-containing protein [Desulfovibrio sp.]|uniref:alpha-ketoacid dehydrogenase subunit beta n=1 Tax=Desulfovibrio sp. TaxID=885 RepID=UPI002B7F9A58|nr:transketolase C-terminal domain-containing protein [Desulfovibrio sp.]HMM39174.1 transketolase C-terminal domain-containing protein [Desulfovibrio sp.]